MWNSLDVKGSSWSYTQMEIKNFVYLELQVLYLNWFSEQDLFIFVRWWISSADKYKKYIHREQLIFLDS